VNTRLSDHIGSSASNPDVVRVLIEFAESSDCVPQLVECARKQNPTNVLLRSIDLNQLAASTDIRAEIGRAAGSASFKNRIIATLSQLDDPRLAPLAGVEFEQLLRDANDSEVAMLYNALRGAASTVTTDVATQAVVSPLANTLRRWVPLASGTGPHTVNLARAHVPGIDASDLDLHEADLAFANLRRANLRSANLWRSRAIAVDVTQAEVSHSNLEEARWHRAIAKRARFHDCRMVSAFFKDAVLNGAQFYRSRLQGAHFERADLTGAMFQEANLSNAYFDGAIIDDIAAASIAKARNWTTARFDDATKQRISRKAKK
jgi:uncharacterized protein YjbI with pentapeptide repeats